MRKKMKALKTTIKVALQDIAIVITWLLLMPFIFMAINPLPQWLFGLLFLSFIAIYFIILFYSNAELFKFIKNDYAWSLSTGLLTLFVFVVPSVMWVTHNNIYNQLESAFT